MLGLAKRSTLAHSLLTLSALVVACMAFAPCAGAATGIPDLAAKLSSTSTSSLHARSLAVRETLARGGIATREGKHTFNTAVKPVSARYDSRYETVMLAMDQKLNPSGRISLDEFGAMLVKLKVFKAKGRKPGDAVANFLARWVTLAKKHPKRWDAFTPLMLAELSKRETPAVDLSKTGYDTATAQLTLLQTQLLLGAFDRIPGAKRKRGASRKGTRALAAAGGGLKNCTDQTKAYLHDEGDGWSQPVVASHGALGGDLLANALARLVGGGGTLTHAEVQGAMSAVLSVVNSLFRLQKLAALYSGVYISSNGVPKPEDNPPYIEKPEEQQNYQAGQDQYGDAMFVAIVGLTDSAQKQFDQEISGIKSPEWRELRKILSDCASYFGVPTPTFNSDVAEDIDTFKVRWTLHASPKTANYEFKKTKWFSTTGTGFKGSLERFSPTIATHTMHVAIPTQPVWTTHPDDFYQHTDTAQATADLLLAQPPTAGTAISAAAGGLGVADAILETLVGFFQTVAPPSDTGAITVSEHLPKCGPLGGLAVFTYTPGTCGPVYAHVSVSMHVRFTQENCPDITSTNSFSGSTNSLSPDGTQPDTTLGTGTATGEQIWYTGPWDAPTDACGRGAQAFSAVPFNLAVSKIDDSTATLVWWPSEDLDFDDPSNAAALLTAGAGWEVPIQDGTYEFDKTTLGSPPSAVYEHHTVTVSFSDTPQ
jgi:hypothetical protein